MSALDPGADSPEYIVMLRKSGLVVARGDNWSQMVRIANALRRAGNAVTIFKATKG